MSDNKTEETHKRKGAKTKKEEEDLTGVYLFFTLFFGTLGLIAVCFAITLDGLWLSYLTYYLAISSVMWFIVESLTKSKSLKVYRTVALYIIVGLAVFVSLVKVVREHNFLIIR